MRQVSVPEILLIAGVATLLLAAVLNRELLAKIIEALHNFRNGGGPGSPMHPLPASDSHLLNRRNSVSS